MFLKGFTTELDNIVDKYCKLPTADWYKLVSIEPAAVGVSTGFAFANPNFSITVDV